MGCALSHLRIWMKLVKCAAKHKHGALSHQQQGGGGSGGEGAAENEGAVQMAPETAEWLLVLEDDVEFRHDFAALLRRGMHALAQSGREWDFMCVGSRQALVWLVNRARNIHGLKEV